MHITVPHVTEAPFSVGSVWSGQPTLGMERRGSLICLPSLFLALSCLILLFSCHLVKLMTLCVNIDTLLFSSVSPLSALHDPHPPYTHTRTLLAPFFSSYHWPLSRTKCVSISHLLTNSIHPLCPFLTLTSALSLSPPLPFPYPHLCPALPLSSFLPCPALPFPCPPFCPALPCPALPLSSSLPFPYPYPHL